MGWHVLVFYPEPGLNACTVHVLMTFCHRVDHSFFCKAKEGRHGRIHNVIFVCQNCALGKYKIGYHILF